MFDIWCRWTFYLFLHKIVVYRHFYIYNMASKMAANGHVTIFILRYWFFEVLGSKSVKQPFVIKMLVLSLLSGRL